MAQVIKRKPVASATLDDAIVQMDALKIERPILTHLYTHQNIASDAKLAQLDPMPVDTPVMVTEDPHSLHVGNAIIETIDKTAIVGRAERPNLRNDDTMPDLDRQLEELRLETDRGDYSDDLQDIQLGSEESTTAEILQTDAKPSRFKATFNKAEFNKALGDVKHFAGGLVSRPYEATRHYSIMRHSPAIVFYSGPDTSVAITIFSDEPLPPERTLWLQKRGLSGNLGMNIKAAHSNRSSWIDVTPSVEVPSDALPQENERAYQRDIKKFLKKVKAYKRLSSHRPYETNVVRIPHLAEDGYLRIVLCIGKKVICPSPVFRYASSSLDPSILRGASISSIPLEVGVKVGSIWARRFTAAKVVQPATNAVQNVTQKYQLGSVTQWAATTVYDASGADSRFQDTVKMANEQYSEQRAANLTTVGGDATYIGFDTDGGPLSPYPIQFSGKITYCSEKDQLKLGLLVICLTGIDKDTLLRLSGVYAGWVCSTKPRLSRKSSYQSNLSSGSSVSIHSANDAVKEWYRAMIIISPRDSLKVSVVQHKDVYLHVCHDMDGDLFSDMKLKVMIMAFLRNIHITPLANAGQTEGRTAQVQHDISQTNQILSRPAWSPEEVLERIKTESSNRSLSERLAGVKSTAQKQIDKVPVHRFGVKTESMALKDQLIGRGGFSVQRWAS